MKNWTDKHARIQSRRDSPYPLCNARKHKRRKRCKRPGMGMGNTQYKGIADSWDGTKGYAKRQAHRLVRRRFNRIIPEQD